MNGLLTKLHIIKSNTWVKRGQMLYNSFEDIATKSGKNLPEGLYIVKSVQLTHSNEGCEDNKKRYLHNLDLVAVECDGINKLSLKEDNYHVSVDNSTFENNFGIGRKAKKGIIYEYIKDQFFKVGKEGFNPNIDYDTIFNKMAWKAISKSPIKISEDNSEDIIMDALMWSVTPKTVKAYDPKRSIIKYFSSMFYNRVIDMVEKWLKHHREPTFVKREEDNFTEEEKIEFRRKDDKRPETPEEKVRYRELVKGLRNFIKGRVKGEKQLKIFDDLMAGYSGTDIAEKNNISKTLVSRFTNDLRKSMVEYAKKTDNKDLNRLMSEYSKKRIHSDSDEDISLIYNVLKEYKKKFGSDVADREPSGEVTKIKKIILEDKVSDLAIANVVLSDSYSSKALKEDLEEYFSLLGEQDELIDSEEGRLTGLKIVSDEVRSIEDRAKCKRKKKSKFAKKEKGYFVYSRCGMGPHKVLRIDGTFSIKLNPDTPVKVFKSEIQAEKATSRYQHTKLNLNVGVYPDEYLKEDM